MSSLHTVSRIILASPGTGGHTAAALMTATVLSGWFDVPLVLATDDQNRRQDLEAMSQTLGILTEDPVCFDTHFCEELLAFAHDRGPSVVVGDPTDLVLDVAARSTQPTFLVAPADRQRLATGPLVLDGAVGAEDLETLALAAAWSSALEQPVQIVEEVGETDSADIEVDRHRLAEMGVDVSVDRVLPQAQNAAVVVSQTRDALALVTPNRFLFDDVTTGPALLAGVNVLVAACPNPVQSMDLLARWGARPPTSVAAATPRAVEELDPVACMSHMRGAHVGRLAFVDAGWPVILPINYRLTRDGEIIFKSVVGSKTSAAARSAVACFEVDGVDETTREGWSVVAQGTLGMALDPRDLDSAWRNDPEPWIEGDDWRWLRLVPISVSGRRLVVSGKAAERE